MSQVTPPRITNPYSKTKTPTSPLTQSPLESPDRFIPLRRCLENDFANFALTQLDFVNDKSPSSPSNKFYQKNLVSCLFTDPNRRGVLTNVNSTTPTTPLLEKPSNIALLYRQNRKRTLIHASFVPTKEDRILDAPGMQDDFYLHLLSWSPLKNVLAIALQNSVYLWNADSTSSSQLCSFHRETENDGDPPYCSSLAWSSCDPQTLAVSVGPHSHDIELWDTEASSIITKLRGTEQRVGVLSWNQSTLTSGCRDGSIIFHDVRSGTKIHHIRPHIGEVCGLTWSNNSTNLASGGNDNLIYIWDNYRLSQPRLTLRSHCAAVKALAWSPRQSQLLASGGGAEDRTLRFWNTCNGVCLNSFETNSQVCQLIWSRHSNELVTSHGFSEYQLAIWKYPNVELVSELKGHSARVLHMALSPDGQTVASAAADETLRFWKCFAPPSNKKKKKTSTSFPDSSLTIR